MTRDQQPIEVSLQPTLAGAPAARRGLPIRWLVSFGLAWVAMSALVYLVGIAADAGYGPLGVTVRGAYAAVALVLTIRRYRKAAPWTLGRRARLLVGLACWILLTVLLALLYRDRVVAASYAAFVAIAVVCWLDADLRARAARRHDG